MHFSLPSRFAGLSDINVVSRGTAEIQASLIRINFPDANADRLKVCSREKTYVSRSLNANFRPR
jgi:hypothetical protein